MECLWRSTILQPVEKEIAMGEDILGAGDESLANGGEYGQGSFVA